MAFGPSDDAYFSLDGHDVSQYLSGLDPTFSRAMAELKTFGTHYVQQVAGHIMGRLAVDAEFDPTLDGWLWTVFTGSAAVAWEYGPQGSGAGKVRYSGNCWISEYKPGVASGDAEVKEPFTLVSDGTITRDTFV